MTLAKITVTGRITKAPEKRFTQSNIALTSFVIAVNDSFSQDETLVRVMAWGNLADRAADSVKEGDCVLVDGRLQTANVKTSNGRERRIFEINASSVEKIILAESAPAGNYSQMQNSAPASAPVQSAPKSNEIVQFAVDEISEDLIDEDEIPF